MMLPEGRAPTLWTRIRSKMFRPAGAISNLVPAKSVPGGDEVQQPREVLGLLGGGAAAAPAHAANRRRTSAES